MTLPSLVSFSGYANAGKTAAADILSSRAKFAKTSMTKPLEQVLLKLNPWIVDPSVGTIERYAELHANLGYKQTLQFEEVLRLLHAMGNDVGRKTFRQTIWTDPVFEEIRSWQALGKSVALSGVRYPDEAALVREHGGVCVWIDRPRTRPKNSNSTGQMLTATDCDLVVVNDGTLKDLYVNIVIGLEEHAAAREAE